MEHLDIRYRHIEFPKLRNNEIEFTRAILRNGNIIKGLTTAASIWVVAAIGLCVGAGFFLGAITCTVIVLMNLLLFNKWEKIWRKKRRYHEIEMVVILTFAAKKFFM